VQYILDIPNDKVAKKILSIVGCFKSDGVKIKPSNTGLQEPSSSKYTDEYVKEHWREFIYSSSGDPLQDDDEVLKEEYGKHLYDKYNS